MKTTLTNYPKTVFGLMVINILLSAVLSFTVFRQRDKAPPPKKPVKMLAPLSSGISQVMQAGEALREMLQLKKAIDSLSSRKQLSAADSAFLDSALTRFNQLQHQFNQRK